VGLPRATHLAILVDGYRRHDWLLEAVDRRVREELAKLDLRLNEAKSRIVDLAQGEAFGFLGFEFRRIRSRRGVWRPQYTPQQKKRRCCWRSSGRCSSAISPSRLGG
jgi:RNA-directed DNA polymerase